MSEADTAVDESGIVLMDFEPDAEDAAGSAPPKAKAIPLAPPAPALLHPPVHPVLMQPSTPVLMAGPNDSDDSQPKEDDST